MPKHRSGGLKKEHTILKGFVSHLHQLASLDGVHSVLPGEIARRSGGSQRDITFQYPTDTGAKLLIKSSNAVQEVFVVCENTQSVQQFVNDRSLT